MLTTTHDDFLFTFFLFSKAWITSVLAICYSPGGEMNMKINEGLSLLRVIKYRIHKNQRKNHQGTIRFDLGLFYLLPFLFISSSLHHFA